jgi:hypothetical protein
VRWEALGTATFALSILVAPAAIGQVHAQVLAPSPLAAPPPGFVPPYEIMRTVRAVGLDPLAPPLREGTTYVLRARDFRGILMRVVVDANTGTIRAVNRIVPAPVMPGQIGMMPPPYAAPPDDMPPDGGGPPEFDASPLPPNGHASLPPPPFAPRQPAARSSAHSNAPPLPRPRPAALASRKPAEDIKPGIVVPSAASGAAAPNADKKSDARPDATTASAPRAPAATKSDKAPPPPIND